MNEINLFPAFEGPEHQNLHSKGTKCVCRPYFHTTTQINNSGQSLDITSIRHQPLLPENPDNPSSWLIEAQMEDWEQEEDQ